METTQYEGISASDMVTERCDGCMRKFEISIGDLSYHQQFNKGRLLYCSVQCGIADLY